MGIIDPQSGRMVEENDYKLPCKQTADTPPFGGEI